MTDLRPGIYLVGRRDGGAAPFLCRINGDNVHHHVSVALVNAAIADSHDVWWWRRMQIPDTLPDDFLLSALMPFEVNRGGL